MAKLYDLDPKPWQRWLESRPKLVREIAERWPPNLLYRLKTTGQRVTIYSVNENGTLTVEVTGQFNLIAFDRQVFGINPHDLAECELPGPHEPVGTALTDPEEIKSYIDLIRPLVLAGRKPQQH